MLVARRVPCVGWRYGRSPWSLRRLTLTVDLAVDGSRRGGKVKAKDADD